MIISIKTHYALIILTELTGLYGKRGLTTTEIAAVHDIPDKKLLPVAEKLHCLGFIKQEESSGIFSLKRSPKKISIYEIVLAFEPNLFSAYHSDSDIRIIQGNNLAKMFIVEREKILKSIKNRLTRLRLHHWYERSRRTFYI